MKLKSGDTVLVLPTARDKYYFHGPILTPIIVRTLSPSGKIIQDFYETECCCFVADVVKLDSSLLKELM